MALATATIAAIGLGISAIGVGVQAYGQSQAASAQKKLTQQQKEAEEIRKQQANLESMRRKREIIRQAQLASATATSTATAQGGAESSGLAGALGTISGASGRSWLATNQNEELGNAMFENNKQIAGYMGDYAQASGTALMGGSVSTLGGAMMKNNDTIAKVGSYYAPSLFRA